MSTVPTIANLALITRPLTFIIGQDEEEKEHSLTLHIHSLKYDTGALETLENERVLFLQHKLIANQRKQERITKAIFDPTIETTEPLQTERYKVLAGILDETQTNVSGLIELSRATYQTEANANPTPEGAEKLAESERDLDALAKETGLVLEQLRAAVNRFDELPPLTEAEIERSAREAAEEATAEECFFIDNAAKRLCVLAPSFSLDDDKTRHRLTPEFLVENFSRPNLEGMLEEIAANRMQKPSYGRLN